MAPDPQGQDPTAASGQDPAAASNTPPAPDPKPASGQDPAPSPAGDPVADNELRRAREEAAKSRTELREAKDALKAAQDALKAKDDEGKSEMQKAMDRVAELEGKFQLADRTSRTLRLQNEVMLASGKLDIVDPDAAYRLLDTDKVEYDGDRPANIGELLEELITQRPYLKATPIKQPKTPAATSSPAQPAAPTTGKLTMADIDKMSSDEINARWEEIKPVLAASKGR